MRESIGSFVFARCLGQNSRIEVVVTFLAVLELMKIGKIHLTQEHAFDDMDIEILEAEGEETAIELNDLEDK